MFFSPKKQAQMSAVRRRDRTHSPEETRRLGADLARSLRAGDVVLLRGDLGAGKSVLAHGLAEGLGISTWRGSPTFALVHEYAGEVPLFHVDLYRLQPIEVEELGLEEYTGGVGITVVEWADRAQEFLARISLAEPVWVDVVHAGAEERLITIHPPSRRAPAFVAA
jgi:tRNA threonylcarbamoyladenosine biosynthesis protein TsaE